MALSAPRTPRDLTFFEALLPILAGAVVLGLSFVLFGNAATSGPLQTAIVGAAAGAMLIGRRAGHDLASLRDAALAGVTGGFGTIAVLFAVGALLGTWAMSGTLLAFGYYLLQVVNAEYFFVKAALITAVVGFTITSAWTAASTIGICLVGIAQQIGLDPAITAGAVVSGAYFGDKASPRSSKTKLAIQSAGVDPVEHAREALWTSLPAFLLALAGFWWLGEVGMRDPMQIVALIDAELHIRPLLLLPLALVLILAVAGLPPFANMLAGALAGGLVAVVLEPERVIAFGGGGEALGPTLALLKGVWRAMATGFVSTTGVAGIDGFLSRGGMAYMLETIWLIAAALAFGGVVERIGLLHRLVEPIAAAARSPGALVTTVVGAGIATNALTADQSIGIGLSERMLKPSFAARGLAPVVLSRAAADSATVTSALIPWSGCGAYLAAALGVATFAYAPYALFNLASPLVTVLFAWVGFRMLRTHRQGMAAPS
ncbi:MAG: Na+/H+ antiporter NhaC family protein [Geminicoccaceae bacterium]